MRRSLLLLLCIHFLLQVSAQYKVRFVVKDLSEIKRDSIFISGTFNDWDSVASKNYKLESYENQTRSIVLTLPAGNYRYKYTGGSWYTVEKKLNGDEQPDRTVTVTKDIVIKDTVFEWRDLMLQNKRLLLSEQPADTSRVTILASMASIFIFNPDEYNADSAFYYIQQTMDVMQSIRSSDLLDTWTEYKSWLIIVNDLNALFLHSLGNYSKSLELRLENLDYAEDEKNVAYVLNTLIGITDDYMSMKDFTRALEYCKRTQSYIRQNNLWNNRDYAYYQQYNYSQTAICYYQLDKFDSALYYGRNNYAAGIQTESPVTLAESSLLLGDIYAARNNPDSAFYRYRSALSLAFRNYSARVVVLSLQGIAKLYQEKGQVDSALYYGLRAFAAIQNYRTELLVWGQNADSYTAELCPLIAALYKSNHQPDSAYKYLQLSVELKDRLFNADKVREFQNLSFNESVKRMQLEQQNKEAKQQYETRIKVYSLIVGLVVLLSFALILYRNNRQKQKANVILHDQKQHIEQTLEELKNTQNQLIQSEKMASLGELTAGIAHEIQNPLNFVNNFSEVNQELIDELVDEVDRGNYEEVKVIAVSLKDNEEKIIQHGKRADAIVKGMLQHSRSGKGIKEPTDINQLTDEYLRLAYHGLRAKDKNFNAELITDFDESIGKITIVPQDIGRVLLNLFNNAFYAVNEKAKLPGISHQALAESAAAEKAESNYYVPRVAVVTKKLNNKIEIRVSDNGNGISQNIVSKIFQPFFTTKPTGQGTGLGLSLAYDTVKAHGGELQVKTKEGEGSEFVIQLPGLS